MSKTKDILDGYNAGFIIQQKRPEVYKQLEPVLNEVELPFFDAFIKGGIESMEERLKSLMLDKNNSTPLKQEPSKDELDIDLDI